MRSRRPEQAIHGSFLKNFAVVGIGSGSNACNFLW